MSKKQFSGVTQTVDEIGMISLYFFPLIKWDIQDCNWFSITCVNGNRRGVLCVQISVWMYITHQWLSAELTGATALCWAQASPSRAGDGSASHPGSGRRCWRTQNHLRVFVVLCHAVCSLLRGAGCISSPLTSALFKRGSLKGCQDTAANCPDFPPLNTIAELLCCLCGAQSVCWGQGHEQGVLQPTAS